MFARNVGQVNAALMIHSRVPLRLGELARASGLPRQIVASALLTLEKRGIVKRTRANTMFSPRTSQARTTRQPTSPLWSISLLPRLAVTGGRVFYGSMAVREDYPRSDIDLLLVGDWKQGSGT